MSEKYVLTLQGKFPFLFDKVVWFVTTKTLRTPWILCFGTPVWDQTLKKIFAEEGKSLKVMEHS